MKNIYVLPAEKPSILYAKDDNYKLANSTMAMDWYISSVGYKPYNIYITSGEEIKEGNWCLNEGDFDKHLIFKADSFFFDTGLEAKKIILTTDQDLIKHGVQTIDDEFLEWFIKNPNFDAVDISTYHIKGDVSGKLHYKIIPQCKHENIKREDGLDECLDCGVRNY
jgi:hypothetical protein